jgi:hypothetical protein
VPLTQSPVYTRTAGFQPRTTSHVGPFSDLAQRNQPQLEQSSDFSKRAPAPAAATKTPSERAERNRIEGLVSSSRQSDGNLQPTRPATRSVPLDLSSLPPLSGRDSAVQNSPVSNRVSGFLNATRRVPK